MSPLTTGEQPASRGANAWIAGLALAYFLLEWLPGITGVYGHFIDELYYIACTRHLDWAYVDHPPLSIGILAALRAVLGESLAVMRLAPALCGAGLVVITGLTARRLGAGAFGQALAAGAVMSGAIGQVMFSFYSMNAIDMLIWAGCFYVLVEIERRGDPRLWLLFGLLAGFGLENKHTIVLLAIGLGMGLLLTPARRHLASRWLWAGLSISALLLLPNLLWQQAEGWPSLEFYRNADLYKNVATPPLEALMQQVLYMNPFALPVWLGGLFFLLWHREGRPWRHLGWLFLVLLAMMIFSQKSRPDRLTPAYAIVFAAGGVLLERVSSRGGWRWLRVALPAGLLVGLAVLAPLSLPLLSPERAAAYGAATGIVPQVEAGQGKRTSLPQWLADRLGWEQLARDVEAAAARLTPGERERAIVLAPSYGQAGAIELFGHDLPPVYGVQNSTHHWGPPPDPVEAAVIVGFSDETLERIFEQVELVGIHDCDGCMPWRDNTPIRVARRPRAPFSEIWPRLRHYE